MKQFRLPLVIAAMLASAGPALAGCGTSQSYLNQSQVGTVLGGNFVCAKSAALNPPGWNERHVAGGTLVEQHEGGTTVETVGSWVVTNSSGHGRVAYTYKGGVAPVYEVAVVGGNCSSGCTTLPQTYQFCGVGGGAPALLTVYVSAAFQAPSSVGVMNGNCPGNP